MSEKQEIDYDQQQLTLFTEIVSLADEIQREPEVFEDESQLSLDFSSKVAELVKKTIDTPEPKEKAPASIIKHERPSKIVEFIKRKAGIVLLVASLLGASVVSRNCMIDRENDKIRSHVKVKLKKEAARSFKNKLKKLIETFKKIQSLRNLVGWDASMSPEKRKAEISNSKYSLNYQPEAGGCTHTSTFKVVKENKESAEFDELESNCFLIDSICIDKKGNRIMIELNASLVSKYNGKDLGYTGEDELKDIVGDDEWMIDIDRSEDGTIRKLKFTPLFVINGTNKQIPITDLSFEVNDSELIELLTRFFDEKAKYEAFLKEYWSKRKASNKKKGLEKSIEFNKKLQRGTVQFKSDTGLCTGFVYDDHTIVTAEHCIRDMEKIHSIVGLQPNGSKAHPKYKFVKGSKKFKTAYDKKHDYAVIVFDKPILRRNHKLKIAKDTIMRGAYYYYLHFLQYNKWHWGTKWKVDKVPITEYFGSDKDGTFQFDACEVILGNSGTPVVNQNGAVVSMISKTLKIDGVCQYNYGPSITEDNIQELIGLAKK